MQNYAWANNRPNISCLVVLPALIAAVMIAFAGSVVAVLERVLLMRVPVSDTSIQLYMLCVVPFMQAVSSFVDWVNAQY